MKGVMDPEQIRQELRKLYPKAMSLAEDSRQMEDLLEEISLQKKRSRISHSMESQLDLILSLLKKGEDGKGKPVSSGVKVALISALLYLLEKDDYIPDSIRFIGTMDDQQVLTYVLDKIHSGFIV